MARTDIQMNVRIPELLKAMLESAATQSGRSVTSEIVYRLEASFPENLTDLLITRRTEEAEMVMNRLDKCNRFAMRLEAAGATDDLASMDSEIALLQGHLNMLQDDLRKLSGDLATKRDRNSKSESSQVAPPAHKKARARRA